MITSRNPNFHATYNGDCTHMVGQVVGPTTYGQYQVAVVASFDEATNKTRVGFCPATVADVPSAS